MCIIKHDIETRRSSNVKITYFMLYINVYKTHPHVWMRAHLLPDGSNVYVSVNILLGGAV